MAERTHSQDTSHPAVAQMCAAADVSRAEFYRFTARTDERVQETSLRDEIQRIALEWPAYGYRRITRELQRRGHQANHKRVLSLMREDNLLCLRKRAWVRTTDSEHGLVVYPNLVPELALTGPDQLWVSDITYIRLLREFIYLAVILDAWSRRVIGWALEPHLASELALSALHLALSTRQVREGLVHHSDRGVQYACGDYTDLLTEHGIKISMSRRGNPYDNALCERFMRTLKCEEVYLFEYDDVAEARARIGHFLEDVYNKKRLHSALGYVPPAEFEQSHIQPKVA